MNYFGGRLDKTLTTPFPISPDAELQGQDLNSTLSKFIGLMSRHQPLFNLKGLVHFIRFSIVNLLNEFAVINTQALLTIISNTSCAKIY